MLDWLKRNCPPGTAIASNEPAATAFFGKYPSLSPRMFVDGPAVVIPDGREDLLVKKMTELGARYLVLFSSPEGPQTES